MTFNDFWWEQLSCNTRNWIKEQAEKDKLTIEQETGLILTTIVEDKFYEQSNNCSNKR